MAHADSQAEHGHHIIPFKTLLSIFLALVSLTVLTVAVAQVHLGPLNVPVAIAIAVAKASLVVMFFMALKYDRPVNAMVFTVGTIFVIVFIVFTLFDTAFRGDLGNVDPLTISESEAPPEQVEAPNTLGEGAASDTTAEASH